KYGSRGRCGPRLSGRGNGRWYNIPIPTHTSTQADGQLACQVDLRTHGRGGWGATVEWGDSGRFGVHPGR
ncbi:hypothetical protein J7E96_36220, partial [Streptomyces sp. ISL-96]|uniref:hypothetical protein n=1 Tax=Streptomyces sp. ISL-96 TaxID=2819191 RepID=UPI001BEA0C10